jgi:hypothetical protein
MQRPWGAKECRIFEELKVRRTGDYWGQLEETSECFHLYPENNGQH